MARVPLTTLASGYEADMLCGELQANGIECWSEKTDAGGGLAVVVNNPQIGPTTVFVDETRLDEARKLLPDHQ